LNKLRSKLAARARAVANGVRLGSAARDIKRLNAGKVTQGQIARSYYVSCWTISRLS